MKKILFLSVLLILLLSVCAFSAKEIISVKSFGAKGNGKTDDTVAVQKAINEAAKTKKPLYIPVGEYKITKTLTCVGLKGMKGETYGSSVFVYYGEGYCLDMRGALYGGYENISVRVEEVAVGKKVESGILMSDGTIITNERLVPGRFKGSGILIGNADNQVATETGAGVDGTSDKDRSAGNYFDKITVTGGNIGIRIDGGCWINYFYLPRVQGCDVGIYLGTAANSIDFVSPVILSNRIGVQLAGPLFGVHFMGGLCEENFEKGFSITGELDKISVSIRDMYFEQLHAIDIYLNGKIHDLSVSDCYFAGYAKDKGPVFVHTNKYPYSSIIFNNNFHYLAYQPYVYDLNGATITIENTEMRGGKVKNGKVLTPVYKETTWE